jgi:tripartite-type tricarboxylate transporter receptor subunit TctC
MVVNSEAFATVNPLLFKDSMRYDPKDFTPISLLGEQQAVLATSPASGIKDFRDFLQKARSDRGITYTSAGVGSTSHLATSYLAQTVGGLKVVHVPFTGGAPAMNALVGGQVDSAFIIAGNVVPFAQSGKVVPIAVSGKTRLSQLPNVPTVAELGYPSFDAVQGMVLLVHADTPAEKKTELAKLSRAAMDSQKIREFMDRTAMKLVNSTPQEAQTWLDRERRLWTELIQNQKIIAEKP